MPRMQIETSSSPNSNDSKNTTADGDTTEEVNSSLLNTDEGSVSSSVVMTIDDALENMGIGWYHRRMVFILGLGNVADAVEILAIGYILTVYEKSEGELSPLESSVLTAACFAGMLCGGFISGIAADKFGRRPVLLTTLGINGTAGLLAALSPSISWLILWRTVAGLGVGGTVTALFALCVEHLPATSRGFYVTILCSFWMVGSILTASVAWIMLGDKMDGTGRILDISWRWFAGCVSIPSLVCLFLSYNFVPESARFLVSQGKVAEAQVVLGYINSVNGVSRQSTNYRPKIEKPAEQLPPPPGHQNSWKDRHEVRKLIELFHKPMYRVTVSLISVSFCLSFGAYGLATWITMLFKSVGLLNPFANAFLYAAANLPGNVISALLIDKVGRIRLLAVSLTLAALSTLFFALNTDGSATLVVAVSCMFNAAATSSWNAYGVLSAESFPTSNRGSGMSLLNCVGRLGAITAQFVNGFLVGPPPHVALLLFVTSGTMLCGAVSATALPRESQGLVRTEPSRSAASV